MGLIGAVFAAPASADMMKWSRVSTPDRGGMVILPQSDILDYDIGGDGDTIYAVLELDEDCDIEGDCDKVGEEGDDYSFGFALVKSTDGGVTWNDISQNVADAANLPEIFYNLVAVAVAPDDEDWIAVAGYAWGALPRQPMVVASKDGGDNFSYAGDMIDTSPAPDSYMTWIYDMAVSPEVDDIHNIAVAGIASDNIVTLQWGSVFRLKAGTWLAGTWHLWSHKRGLH